MRRAIAYLFLLAGAVALALFLADLGGSIEIRVGDVFVGVPFSIAMMILVVAFLLGWGLLAVIGAIKKAMGR